MNASLIIVTLVSQLSGAMVITYLLTLHDKLEYTNIENIKLLDGMHEGLLICNKDCNSGGKSQICSFDEQNFERSVIFCNRPVKKLFAEYVG